MCFVHENNPLTPKKWSLMHHVLHRCCQFLPNPSSTSVVTFYQILRQLQSIVAPYLQKQKQRKRIFMSRHLLSYCIMRNANVQPKPRHLPRKSSLNFQASMKTHSPCRQLPGNPIHYWILVAFRHLELTGDPPDDHKVLTKMYSSN